MSCWSPIGFNSDWDPLARAKGSTWKLFSRSRGEEELSQTALVADVANRINLRTLACIKTNKLLASGSNALDYTNTQLWVFPLRLAHNNNNINNSDTPVDIEELPRSIGSLHFIAQLRVEQHRWVEFGSGLCKAVPSSVGCEGGGGFVLCCGCITSQQSLTQTCTNKSKHVIDWWDSMEINPQRQESSLNCNMWVVGEASLRTLANSLASPASACAFSYLGNGIVFKLEMTYCQSVQFLIAQVVLCLTFVVHCKRKKCAVFHKFVQFCTNSAHKCLPLHSAAISTENRKAFCLASHQTTCWTPRKISGHQGLWCY